MQKISRKHILVLLEGTLMIGIVYVFLPEQTTLRHPPRLSSSQIYRTNDDNTTIVSKPSTALVRMTESHTAKKVDPEPGTNFYDVTTEESGPILRDYHLINTTRRQTNNSRIIFSTWNGTFVRVGQLVTFSIEIDKDQGTIFSVLGIGKHHIFVGQPAEVSDFNSIINFTFTPTVPGVYDLFVEEVLLDTQLQLPGSPFRLVIEGDPSYAEEIGRRGDRLPSCQTLRQTNPSWQDGEWITRKVAGRKRGVLRSGWSFQPNWCSFDIFTTEDIAKAAEESSAKTIVILGSSIERGIFFSLVDLLLDKMEKMKLTESDLSQCWGYAEMKIGNFRLVYQDFRTTYSINYMGISEENGTATDNIICHDEKVAKQGDYHFFGEGMRFLKEYLFTDTMLPNVVLLPVSEARQLKLLLNSVPLTWTGTIYCLYNFRSKKYTLYTKKGLDRTYQEAQKLVALDNRIELIDGFVLGSGMRHNTESAPLLMGSQHYHRWCNELNGTMRVCGNPTELIAQMILGKVIAPDGKEAWLTTLESVEAVSFPRDITVCQDCPASLLPFHIKVIPDLSCYMSSEILQNSGTKHDVWDGTMCPADCLDTEPVGKELTQSGSVDVRICNLKLI